MAGLVQVVNQPLSMADPAEKVRPPFDPYAACRHPQGLLLAVASFLLALRLGKDARPQQPSPAGTRSPTLAGIPGLTRRIPDHGL